MEYTFVDVLKIVVKRIEMVIIIPLLCLVIASAYCMFVAKPVYSANATVLIASGALFKDEGSSTITSEYITTGELSTSFALMKSFSGILTESVEYYDKALAIANEKGLNASYSVSKLAGATKINYDEESIILDITVRVNDRHDAQVLIDALAECAPEAITSRLGRTSAVVLNVDSRSAKVAPNIPLILVCATAGGLLLAITLAIIIERMDKTVKGEEDFVKCHKVPLLGCVPDFESKGKRRIVNQ